MRPLVWLWERDAYWRGLLTELLEEAFTVRQCSGVATVWKDLLAGDTGVLIADFTRLTSLGFADRARLSSLSSLTPVLLLVEDPAIAHAADTEAGRSSVLFNPFEDLDRLLAAAVELSRLTATVGTRALSAF